MRVSRVLFACALVAGCNGPSKLDVPAGPTTVATTVPAGGSAAPTAVKKDPHAPPAIDAAIAQAKTAHKPLVLEFGTTWCHPCQMFETTTLADAKVKAAIERVTFVRYDAEMDPGVAAAQRFKVTSFPTFLALDADGTVRVTQEGLAGDGVAQFLALVDQAEQATTSEADLRARLAAQPRDNALRVQAARWFADRGLDTDALAQASAVVADRTATEDQRGTAQSIAMKLRRVAKWRADLANEKLALARTSPTVVTEDDLLIATVDAGISPATVRDVIGKVLASRTTPADINGLLYVALAAGAKDEALANAKRVLSDSKDPSLLDSLAECFHVHGDKADAVRVEDQAMALADAATKASLEANRARFAAGTGESEEVQRLHERAKQLTARLAKLDTAGGDVAQATAATAPGEGETPTDMASMQQAAMKAYGAQRELASNVAAACQSVAGSSKGAFARVAVDASGAITSSTVFTDAAGSDALRACITKGLTGATLPMMPGQTEPQPLEIAFR